MEDMPGKEFFQKPKVQSTPVSESVMDERLNHKVLNVVKDLNDSFINASRKKIYENLDHSTLSLSEQQIRRVLDNLKARGYVTIKRGRSGTQITPEGLAFLLNS